MAIVSINEAYNTVTYKKNLANFLAQQEIQDFIEFFSVLEQQFSMTVLFKDVKIDEIKNRILTEIMEKNFEIQKPNVLKSEIVKEIIKVYSERMDLNEISNKDETWTLN